MKIAFIKKYIFFLGLSAILFLISLFFSWSYLTLQLSHSPKILAEVIEEEKVLNHDCENYSQGQHKPRNSYYYKISTPKDRANFLYRLQAIKTVRYFCSPLPKKFYVSQDAQNRYIVNDLVGDYRSDLLYSLLFLFPSLLSLFYFFKKIFHR